MVSPTVFSKFKSISTFDGTPTPVPEILIIELFIDEREATP